MYQLALTTGQKQKGHPCSGTGHSTLVAGVNHTAKAHTTNLNFEDFELSLAFRAAACCVSLYAA
jgi:hypothetical protein